MGGGGYTTSNNNHALDNSVICFEHNPTYKSCHNIFSYIVLSSRAYIWSGTIMENHFWSTKLSNYSRWKCFIKYNGHAELVQYFAREILHFVQDDGDLFMIT